MKQIFREDFRKKLAYQFQNEEEGKIRFLRYRDIPAIDREEWEVTRTPQYDRYSILGYVPVQRLLDDGWYFHCWECEKEITSEAWDYEEDEPLELVVLEHSVFCSQSCHDACMERRKQNKLEKEKWTEFLLKNYPKITDLWVLTGTDKTYARFMIPEARYKCEWYSDNPSSFFHTLADTEVVQKYLGALQ